HTRSKRDWSSDVCSSDLPVKDDNDLERFVLLENFNMDKEYLLIDGSNMHFEDIIDFYNLLNTYNFLSDYAVIIHGVNINTIEYEIGRASCRERYLNMIDV